MWSPRARPLVALVALVAFSASLAEAWTGSTCAAPGDAEARGPTASTAHGPAAHGDRSTPRSEADRAPGDAPDCPRLGPMGECGALPLPTAAPSAAFASAPPTGPPAVSAATPKLLLGPSLLRPPIA